MRFVFKTSYDADIKLFKHRAQAIWYALLLALVLATPLYFAAIGDAYLLGEITGVLILAIAGMGLMLLTGHTGLPSLGHATFMALGCYVNINLLGAGVPWIIAFPLSGLIAGVVGTLIALPVLRLHGVYLALATLAMSMLTSDFVVMAEPWTGGIAGAAVPDINIFGMEVNRYSTPYKFYYLVLFVAILIVWFYRNLLRSPTGRSFTAVRDSEISARAMGINLTRTKSTSFFLSATAAGLAGALFGHSAGYVTNETFDLVMSITLLLMIVIGGLGFIHGAFFGAIVVGIIPVVIANGRSFLQSTFDINVNIPGLESALFAFILICFILFEPMGLYGRWLKIRTYFELFPFYRKDMFKRQKSYLKTGPCPMSLLEIENVTLRFGGVVAVDNVSLKVNEGEVFALVGPNGAGKSTIFNLISRFYDPAEGRITFDGHDLLKDTADEVPSYGVARTFQNIELFEQATVLQNLLVGRHRHRTTGMLSDIIFSPKVHREELRHRAAVEEVIDFLNLQAYRDKMIGGLPYGVRKVVELGRALASEPKLLLLDEPASGLSVEETQDMAFWIEDIQTQMGISVMMVEHDMGLVSAVSTRVMALSDGKELATGTAAEVQSHPAVIEAYLGTGDISKTGTSRT